MDGDYPAVTGETLLHQGRFIVFKSLDWVDGYGVSRQWESADRPGEGGAVLIVARLLRSRRVVLIRQYRPPAKCYVYEFPAGLVDAGETGEAAAARELREETGYVARRLEMHPRAFTSPGLSNENVHMVLAEVDEDGEENRELRTEFDSSEMIETVLVGEGDLIDFYRRESAAGNAFDAKLAAYIMARM